VFAMSRTSDLAITPLPAFSDNYLWLLSRDGRPRLSTRAIRHRYSGRWRKRHLKLAAILVTHHHGDHVGGVMALRATGVTVYGPRNEDIDGVDVRLGGGDRLEVLGTPFAVLDVPAIRPATLRISLMRSIRRRFLWRYAVCLRLWATFRRHATQMLESLDRLAACQPPHASTVRMSTRWQTSVSPRRRARQ